MYILSKRRGINILDLANEIDLQARHQRTYMQHVVPRSIVRCYLTCIYPSISTRLGKNYMTISSGTSETRRVFESGNHTSCKGFIVCSAHGFIIEEALPLVSLFLMGGLIFSVYKRYRFSAEINCKYSIYPDLVNTYILLQFPALVAPIYTTIT